AHRKMVIQVRRQERRRDCQGRQHRRLVQCYPFRLDRDVAEDDQHSRRPVQGRVHQRQVMPTHGVGANRQASTISGQSTTTISGARIIVGTMKTMIFFQSIFRCMKKVTTSSALQIAIPPMMTNANAAASGPITWFAVNVSAVKIINPIKTFKKVES